MPKNSIWKFDDLFAEGWRFDEVNREGKNKYCFITREEADTLEKAAHYLCDHFHSIEKIEGTSEGIVERDILYRTPIVFINEKY